MGETGIARFSHFVYHNWMFLQRMGIFLLLLGFLMVLASFATGRANSESLTLFCFGLPLMIFGGTLWYRNRDKTPAQRFRLLRKFSTKEDEDEEED
jgi:hypothetical protein